MKNALSSFALAATLLSLSVQQVLAQDFDKGMAAYENGDHQTALKELRPFAERGNAGAQATLGTIYIVNERPNSLDSWLGAYNKCSH